MTKETLTLSQIIAECKNTKNKISTILSNREFSVVSFYIKSKPYIGPYTIDEVTERITSDLDKISDLKVRYDALNKARIKANSEILVTVPEQLSIKDIFAGKEAKNEEITIAEAINRKKYYREYLTIIATTLEHSLRDASRRKGQLEIEAANTINAELNQQFPRDVQKNWSAEAQKKAREDLELKHAVVRIDPKELIAKDSINKFKTSVMDYINNIDTILSIVNAKTEIEVEY